ncbi:uncharacterized protein FFB20_14734 [Fusarium fujikuroi]|nr:uncharacterized protein FFB20_14734 [Fusarium fujikuroi]
MPPRETAKAKRERLAREAEEARLAEEVEAERIAAEEAEAERIAAEKAEADRTAAKKAEEKRIAFEKKLEADRIAAQKKKAEEARIAAEKFEAERAESKQRHDELMEMLAHAEKEMDDEALEEDRIIKKEQLERQLRILKRNDDEDYRAAKEALRRDFGDHTFKHLAEEVNGIPTPTFDYKAERPPANPQLTIWAYMNALKNCSYKGLTHVKFDENELPEEPNSLFLRKKKGKNLEAEYTLKFSSQNADAMLRHLYGFVMPESLPCNKCMSGNGALAHCRVTAPSEGCANCLWNHSGPNCSYIRATPKKRKAVSDAISVTSGSSSSSSDSEEDPMDTLKDFTEKECRRLSRFFRKVTDHKKKKKKSKGKGKSKSKKAKGSK